MSCVETLLLCQAPWLKGMNATWANSEVTHNIEWQICQDYTVLSDSRHYFWTPCNCRARLQPSLLWEMRSQPRYLVYSSQVPPLSEAGLERRPIHPIMITARHDHFMSHAGPVPATDRLASEIIRWVVRVRACRRAV